jgi:hypothetical protein
MLFRSHIAGGAGIPVYWLGGGEGLSRATALEMGTATYKNLKTRQQYLTYIVTQILDYVLDQAVIAGRLKATDNLKYKVTFPPLSQRDLVSLSTTLQSVASALTLAVSGKMITSVEASEHMRFALNLLGGDLAPEGVVIPGEAADPDAGVGLPDEPGVDLGMKEAVAAQRRVKMHRAGRR